MTNKTALTALSVFLLSGLGYCWPGAAAAESILDIEAGALFDNNLGNGQAAQDMRSDIAFTISVSAGRSFQPGDADSFAVTLDAKSQLYNSFSGMSNMSLGGTLSYRRKMVVGAAAPWLSLATWPDPHGADSHPSPGVR